jgi:hypothetical protein
MNKKIYFSKSKAADPDKIISAKKIAQKLYPECKFIEFKGGNYDPSIIDPADIVIVVLPSPIHKEKNDDLMINNMGKGNYSEASYGIYNGKKILFLVHKKNMDLLDYNNIGIVEYDKKKIDLKEIPEVNPHKNWQNAYATISFKNYATFESMNKSLYS